MRVRHIVDPADLEDRQSVAAARPHAAVIADLDRLQAVAQDPCGQDGERGKHRRRVPVDRARLEIAQFARRFGDAADVVQDHLAPGRIRRQLVQHFLAGLREAEQRQDRHREQDR